MARKAKIEIELEAGDASKDLKGIDKKLGDIQDTAKDSAKAMGGMGKATKGISKGFKGMGLAMKAAGIGIVLKLMSVLFDVFKQNQAVMDTLAVAFETVSIVFNEVVSAVMSVVENVGEMTGGFDATKRIIMNLLKIALTPLKLQFYAIKLGVQQAQLIWEKSFLGDGDPETIKRLNEGIQETKDSIAEVANEAVDAGKEIGEDFVEAAGEVGQLAKGIVEEVSKISIEGALETAKANVLLQKSAKIAAAEQEKLLKGYMREAELQRQTRDDISKSIQDRIEANDKLKGVLDKQEESMVKQADLILASAQAQYDKNASDENYIALLDAQRNKLDVLEDIEGKRSEQKINAVALEKELLGLTQAQANSETQLALDRMKYAAEQKDTELARLEAKKVALEKEKEIERERLQNIIDSHAEGTQERIDAQIAYNEKMQELGFALLDVEKEITEEKAVIRQEEEDKDKQIVADKKARYEDLYASMDNAGQQWLSTLSQGIQTAMEEIEETGKLSTEGVMAVASSTLKAGAMIVNKIASEIDTSTRKGFEKQKKLRVAGAIMDSFSAAIAGMLAGLSVGSPWGIVLGAITAASSLAFGMAQVAKIKKQQFGGGGSVGGGTSVPKLAPSAASPSFSGISPATTGEQGISNALDQNETEPTQAFVVSEQVESGSALDRNIKANAAV